MPLMMNKNCENKSVEIAPSAERQSWDQLYDRIRQLALRKSESMIAGASGEDDEFDRGARALRTLMSAAQAAQKMKLEEAREQSLNDEGAQEPVVSDERIEEIYRSIEQSVERVEQRDRQAKSHRGDPAPALSGAGGKAVEDQRS